MIRKLYIAKFVECTVRIITHHGMKSLFFLLPEILAKEFLIFTCNFPKEKRILPEIFSHTEIGSINKIEVISNFIS